MRGSWSQEGGAALAAFPRPLPVGPHCRNSCRKWQNGVNKAPAFWAKCQRAPGNQKVLGKSRRRGNLGKPPHKIMYALGDVNDNISVMLRMELTKRRPNKQLLNQSILIFLKVVSETYRLPSFFDLNC